jgi:hypothetical protein
LIDLKLAHIVDGDQAINFFTTNEGQARVKFFYCNLVPCNPKEYKPYDMYVCQRLEVNDEYYTISHSGVVHIEPIEGINIHFQLNHLFIKLFYDYVFICTYNWFNAILQQAHIIQ